MLTAVGRRLTWLVRARRPIPTWFGPRTCSTSGRGIFLWAKSPSDRETPVPWRAASAGRAITTAIATPASVCPRSLVRYAPSSASRNAPIRRGTASTYPWAALTKCGPVCLPRVLFAGPATATLTARWLKGRNPAAPPWATWAGSAHLNAWRTATARTNTRVAFSIWKTVLTKAAFPSPATARASPASTD